LTLVGVFTAARYYGMTHPTSSLNSTPCTIRSVDFLLPFAPCDRCGADAQRVDVATRIAIDIDLDQPAVLAVHTSIHFCAPCHHYFRAQPPFLRRDAVYTRRVMHKALASVIEDGMAFRTVSQRLARDFWVRPSEAIIRRWHRTYAAGIVLDEAYHAWIVATFSGILCVDEVYQHDVALLLAVDPAAPEGDRLIGYSLAREGIDAATVTAFLSRLAAAGIQPDEVITDGSTLYPRVLAEIWPQAAHQLCLFHETRRITTAAQEVIRQVRRTLPTPPHRRAGGKGGPLQAYPPSDNPHDPAVQRWHTRQETRHTAIGQVQALARQGWSERAITRQLGLNRRTVHAWLQHAPVTEGSLHLVAAPSAPPPPARLRRTPALVAHLQHLAADGLSYVAIAQQTGLHRVTVSAWLRTAALTPPPVDAPESGTAAEAPVASVLPPMHDRHIPLPPLAPPAPWETWDEVRQVREALREHRGVLLRRPTHLNATQQAQVEALLASPIGPTLAVVRAFVTDWYTLCRHEDGRRRSREDAQARYEAWRQDARYAALTPLRRVLAVMTPERFCHVSQFLRTPLWEATNNGAERGGRAFRHGQGPHFTLRSMASLDDALKVRAYRQKEGSEVATRPVPASSRRGRRMHGHGDVHDISASTAA